MSEPDTPYKRPRPLKQRNVLSRGSRFGPNMTPMVDVTLVILIFFMASASIAGHEWFLRADLPKVQDPDLVSSGFSLPTPTLNVDIFLQEEKIFVRGIGDGARPLDVVVEQIRGMNSAAANGLILQIRAQDNVPYWALVAIHDAGASVSMRVAIR